VTLIKSISGIRGTIGGKPGESLSPLDVMKFTAAFGTWVIESSGTRKVVVGRDARISGVMLNNIVCNTLISLGIDVIDLGLSTTPTVEIAVVEERAGGGIILTASHNPEQWNALKLLNNVGEFISASEGEKVLDIANAEQFSFADSHQLGSVSEDSTYLDKHIDKILNLPLVDPQSIDKCGFRILVDGINSSGGIAVPELLNTLGVGEIKVLNGEPTGRFSHNPEPIPENLTGITDEMLKGDYDLGIVVDPDVDRVAFICENGVHFGEEYTLVAVADYILQNNPGNTVSNLSSTQALKIITEKFQGSYRSAAVGEVNVVTMMKETDAVIGGEGNGGVIYPELHYGRDALVGIALFLSYMAKSGVRSSELRARYPVYVISKNKIELAPNIDVEGILKAVEDKYSAHPINTVDGVKIEFPSSKNQSLTEWIHLRKSNTEPIIRIYAESDSKSAADYLAHKIILDIKELSGA